MVVVEVQCCKSPALVGASPGCLKLPFNMATSMAAAIAATLPTAVPTAAPSQPVEAQIPASQSKLVDIEAEIALTAVQLDGLVVSKILKHAVESSSSVTTGLLLGLDLDGLLEISNSFALPTHFEDEDKSSKSLGKCLSDCHVPQH